MPDFFAGGREKYIVRQDFLTGHYDLYIGSICSCVCVLVLQW